MGDRQTSGSITIDTTAIASAVARGITPTLEQLDTTLSGLTVGRRLAVNYADVPGILAVSLPTWAGDVEAIAEHLAHSLEADGYRLVHAPVPDLAGIAQQSAGDLDKDTTWFDPERTV